MTDPKPPQNQADRRTQRLRSALRDNLKRRKAQAIGRTAQKSGRGALEDSERRGEGVENSAEPSNPPDFTPTERDGR